MPVTTRPTLKAEATIVGDIVRIGDLVENAGAVADVAIFRAPDLGQTGSVPAGRVIDAVLPHQIIGLDTRGLAEVVVTRASRPITAKDIEARILRALAGQSGLPDAEAISRSPSTTRCARCRSRPRATASCASLGWPTSRAAAAST